MAEPISTGTALSLIPSGLQTLTGAMQGFINLFKTKPQRPVYEIPESQRQATAAAERLASGEMPGLAAAKGTLAETSGAAMETIKETSGSSPVSAGAVADVLAKTNQATEDLAAKGAQFKAAQNQQLQQALLRQAQAEDRAWDYNQRQKYDAAAAARSAMTQASMENIFSGVSNIAGAFAYDKLRTGGATRAQQDMGNNNTTYDYNTEMQKRDEALSKMSLMKNMNPYGMGAAEQSAMNNQSTSGATESPLEAGSTLTNTFNFNKLMPFIPNYTNPNLNPYYTGPGYNYVTPSINTGLPQFNQ